MATPDRRHYTLKHGKVLVEAIAAGIEPLEFRRKVEKQMRFDLETNDPDALFNIIAKQQRDQAVIETNDAERRQTSKRSDATSMAAAQTKPQRSAADDNVSREDVKVSGVKAERGIVGTTTTSVPYVVSSDTSSGTAPKTSKVRRGKASMARATDKSLYSGSSLQAIPLIIPGARQPGWPLCLPPLELVRTRPPQTWWLRRRICRA